MLMFSSLLVNASLTKIPLFGRTIVYLLLCHVDNHIRAFNCEEWIAHREFDPIQALEETCLMEFIAY
jgi:ectoine hydroxylase